MLCLHPSFPLLHTHCSAFSSCTFCVFVLLYQNGGRQSLYFFIEDHQEDHRHWKVHGETPCLLIFQQSAKTMHYLWWRAAAWCNRAMCIVKERRRDGKQAMQMYRPKSAVRALLTKFRTICRCSLITVVVHVYSLGCCIKHCHFIHRYTTVLWWLCKIVHYMQAYVYASPCKHRYKRRCTLQWHPNNVRKQPTR